MGNEQKKDYKSSFLWSIVLCATLIIAIIVVVNVGCITIPTWLNITLNAIIALATSAIAGLLVAILVDTPSLVSSFKSMLTESLVSKDYLKHLPENSLEDIRKQVVGLIHKRSCNVPDSFLELDDDLCRLIDAPYYSYLHEQIVCSKRDSFSALAKPGETNRNESIQGLFYKKEVHLEFQIFNPNKEGIEAEIGLTKYIDLPEECELSDALNIKAFEVSIDDDTTYDICNSLIIERSKAHTGHVGSDPNTMTYDTIVRMSVPNHTVINKDNIASLKGGSVLYKNTPEDTKNNVSVHFKNNVRVTFIYSQICPIADSHYTRRIKYSAMNYSLNYSCHDDYALHGQIIGTLIKQSDMSIIKNGANNLSLICRNWLLPKNGAFIVMDDIINK